MNGPQTEGGSGVTNVVAPFDIEIQAMPDIEVAQPVEVELEPSKDIEISEPVEVEVPN
jgi:hypothetical protein